MTSSVVILKSGRSCYAGICLASFDHQKWPKRSFCARTFKVQKYKTKRSGLLMFSEIGKLHAKKIIHFTPAGECVQSVQSLEERLEDLHSLSLNFCLTKFLRKIERAFVQVFSTPLLINFQTHVFGYPNTYFWIYKIFI